MLIDTNIVLEILFRQEHQQDCIDLLEAIKRNLISEKIYLSRFSLSAIEASCRKKNKEFIREFLLLIYNGAIEVKEMQISDDLMINSVREDLGLDFDDATQFVLTQKCGTYIVTYDQDFKNKPIKVKTPSEVLKVILA